MRKGDTLLDITQTSNVRTNVPMGSDCRSSSIVIGGKQPVLDSRLTISTFPGNRVDTDLGHVMSDFLCAAVTALGMESWTS